MLPSIKEYMEKPEATYICWICKKSMQEELINRGTYIEIIFNKKRCRYDFISCIECWSETAGDEFTMKEFIPRPRKKKK